MGRDEITHHVDKTVNSMRISLATYDLQFAAHASKSEMEMHLQRAGRPYDILQAAGGHERRFYSLEFHPQIETLKSRFASIGLCSYGSGIEPQILLNTISELVYVGFDSSLLIFAVPAVLVKRMNLDGPFYSMTLFQSLDRILVVHEIGLLWLSPVGNVEWQRPTDIISKVLLRPSDTLEVTQLDGSRTVVHLTTGQVTDQVAG
jgi:hypothetical protein